MSLSNWLEKGQKAFQQGDYDGAIKAWEQARRKPDTPQAALAALAEAYFRRAMTGEIPDIADLHKARKLQPQSQIYRYHLALAYHRRGRTDEAETAYRSLLADSPPFQRAAEPLAQLLIEQRQAVLKDPVWEQLSPESQTELAAAEALLKQKADSTLNRLAEESSSALWQGLLALVLGDHETARRHLEPLAGPDSELSSPARAVVRYYLGVIEAEAGHHEAAMAHWQAARSDPFDPPHLRHNLSVQAYIRAVAEQQAGHPQKAMELLEKSDVTEKGSPEVKDFYCQLNWEVGYAAAQKNDWSQALTHWQRAEQAGDESRRLVFNLALAYQQQEQYWQAAEHWRTVLYRRPRKEKHPDYLNDQQVARVWQNVAENYSRAGDHEEAIKTYKNAVKWAPDNLELRLKLVEAYQVEGRWQAAENELDRILDKNPDYIPALVQLGEMASEDYFPGRARQIWSHILELEPNHPVARQQLAYTYVEEAERWLVWQRNYERAIEILKEGLARLPNDQRLVGITGAIHAQWGKLDEARAYFDEARKLKPDDLQTYYITFRSWLEYGPKADLRRAWEQIKQIPDPVPGSFFLDLGEQAFQAGEEKLAEEILAHTEGRYPADLETLMGVATGYSDLDQDRKALSILRSLVKQQPDHIELHMQLARIYHYLDKKRLTRKHLDKAETLARRQNDRMQLYTINLLQDELLHGRPPPQNPLEMLSRLPPDAQEEILRDAPPEIAAILRMGGGAMSDILAGLDEEDDFF